MKRYLVELVGTFFLTLAVALTSEPMAVGLMLMALIYMGGHVSGGHFNPAVSLAVWMRGALDSSLLFGYFLAQVAGALLAGTVFYTLTNSWLIMRLPEGVLGIVGMVPEILMTFIFASVILVVATTDRYKGTGITGLAIGLTLTSIATIGGIFNPAIGITSLCGGLYQYLVLGGDSVVALNATIAHIAGPLLGGAVAAYWFGYLSGNRS